MPKIKRNTKDIYNVLVPVYKKDGKIKISVKDHKTHKYVEKEVDNYAVSWKNVGTAKSISDARKRYQDKYPECKHPILENIVKADYKEQDFGY